MTRAEFIAYLERLVMDEELDEDEAADMLRDFDAGRLKVDPPLPPDRMNVDVEAAMLALALYLALNAGAGEEARRRLRDDFDAEARRLAEQQGRGRLRVAEWQRMLWDAIQTHTLTQATAGARRSLTAEQIAALRDDLARQGGYLSRFADVVARGVMVGAALSVAAVAARSIQYGAAGWAWSFKARPDPGRGWIEHYISKDDPATCTPCLEAEEGGPYLPGDGPMPGDVCEGGGNCRCERVSDYDLAAWRGLAGE